MSNKWEMAMAELKSVGVITCGPLHVTLLDSIIPFAFAVSSIWSAQQS
jgi:hypothetical protein